MVGAGQDSIAARQTDSQAPVGISLLMPGSCPLNLQCIVFYRTTRHDPNTNTHIHTHTNTHSYNEASFGDCRIPYN